MCKIPIYQTPPCPHIKARNAFQDKIDYNHLLQGWISLAPSSQIRNRSQLVKLQSGALPLPLSLCLPRHGSYVWTKELAPSVGYFKLRKKSGPCVSQDNRGTSLTHPARVSMENQCCKSFHFNCLLATELIFFSSLFPSNISDLWWRI